MTHDNQNRFFLKPVGYVRSEHVRAEHTPIQPVFAAQCPGAIEVLPAYAEGLRDIEGFSHVIILFWLHQAKEPSLTVTPFLEDRQHGVFATRSPRRPNPIGLSIVELLSRKETILHVRNIDILDGTPVIDIKPYSSRFDSFPHARNGWQDSVDEKTARVRGMRGYPATDPEG